MQLLLGDCLELMPALPDGSVDMVLCDLPYGVTQNRWDSIIPIEPLWEQWHRIAKPNAAIVLFAQGMFTAKLMLSNPSEWRYNLIWKKGDRTSGFLNAKTMSLRNHEDICVFYASQPVYNPQMSKGIPLHQRQPYGGACRRNVPFPPASPPQPQGHEVEHAQGRTLETQPGSTRDTRHPAVRRRFVRRERSICAWPTQFGLFHRQRLQREDIDQFYII